jgi:hypothetical protein
LKGTAGECGLEQYGEAEARCCTMGSLQESALRVRQTGTKEGQLSVFPSVNQPVRLSVGQCCCRPHGSLGFRTPAPEVVLPAFAAWPAVLRPPIPPTTQTVAPRPMLH